jgi:hypothetical protein
VCRSQTRTGRRVPAHPHSVATGDAADGVPHDPEARVLGSEANSSISQRGWRPVAAEGPVSEGEGAEQ